MSCQLQRRFDFAAAERQPEKPSPQKKEGGEAEPSVDASLRQEAESLRSRLLSQLAEAPGPVELRELRSALGHPGAYMDQDPERNPVNRLVKELRDAGHLIVQECDRGSPLVSLPLDALPPAPAGHLFGPHDHWTPGQIAEHEAIRQEYEEAEIPLPDDFDTDPQPPYTGHEQREIDAVDIKGNEGAKRAILIAAASGEPVAIHGPEASVASFRGLAASCDVPLIDDDDFQGFTVQVLEPSRRELETRLPGTSTSQLRQMLEGRAEEPPSEYDRNAEILLEAAAQEFELDDTTRQSIRSLAAIIAQLDGVLSVSSGHLAEAINYLVHRPRASLSSEEHSSHEPPPLVRPDRQITYDGTPHYEWPDAKELHDRDTITVDRITEDIDGPAHRFVIRRGDSVEAYFSKDKIEAGEVVGISHARSEVSVRFAGATNGIWFYVGRIYPAIEEGNGKPRSAGTRDASREPSSASTDSDRVVARDSQCQGMESRDNQRPFRFSDFRTLLGRLEKGELTLPQLKAEFARLQATREELITSLRKDRDARQLKVLAARFGCFDAQRNTKQKNAEHVYRSMLQWFTLSDGIRFNPMEETIDDAVTRIVEAMTEDDFRQELESRQQEKTDHDQALKDPRTLEQFRIALRERDYQELTSEQQDRFDRLMADQTRGRRSRKMETSSEKLTAVAETLEEKADIVLEQDNFKLKNTVRRAEMAAGMRGQAYADKAMAGTLKWIADSLAGDEVRYLDGVRAKTHVETLISLLRRAKNTRNSELMKEHEQQGVWERHADRQELDNRPLELEDVAFVEYPYPRIYKRHLEEAVAVARNTQGLKQRARRMESYLVCTGHYVPFVDEQDIAFLQEFIDRSKGWTDTRWIESGMEDYKRLRAANIHTPQELRSALRELVPQLTAKQDDDPVTKLEERLIGTKIPGFFPTPRPVISRMLELITIEPGDEVLEPSAGKGDILDMLREQHPDAVCTALEMQSTLVDIIKAKGHDVEQANFLQYEGKHDVIVMNPPFENAAEIDHVRHAFDQLVAGGRLVSVMSAGPFFRSDKKADEFRQWLEQLDHDVEDLPEDAFKGVEAFRETGVRTKILTISKPA